MTEPTKASTDRVPDVAETHISTVFFTADRAYKLLKPIETSFLDFSTSEKRLAAVQAEIELNRRMSPDVYLGAADVYEHDELVDQMIVMRRLPSDRRLTELAASPDLDDLLRLIMRRIAAFHAAQEPQFDASDIASRDAVEGNWRDNIADMDPSAEAVFGRAAFDRVSTMALRYLAHSESLFDERLAQGHVRDGHGDLTAQDIFCLDDGPRILDCLAFDQALRISDVLCDVAFLAMDIDRLAGPEAAQSVWEYYREFSNEHHPASLAHHYVAYRAHVRAKIDTIRYRQGDPTAAARARDYLALCERHLELARRRLIVVGGTPGSGKTTVSRKISGATGWSLISSDATRKELTGLGQTERAFVEAGEGIYRKEISAQTYEELFRRAGLLLERGESVVLDASFSDAAHRDRARALAAELGADIVEIECTLDAATAKDRIRRRLERGVDASDARPEILDALRAAHAPWPEAQSLSTAGTVDATEASALDILTRSHPFS